MVNVFHILLLLVGLARVCVAQTDLLNTAKLFAQLDADKDGNITRSDVQSLFTSSFGNNMTSRCRFVDRFVSDFQASPISISVFFDTLQSADRQITVAALTNALMGSSNATNITVSDFTAVINSVNSSIGKIVARPADFTSGYTFWPYTQFQVSRWANQSDRNQNGALDRMEISAAMRSLDEDGDWNIRRCEYINSMILYMQHSVTSSKAYDAIFKGRDINWADVDSDFLLVMMGATGGNVTKQQFIDFFTLQNFLAAGLTVNLDGSLADGCNPLLPCQGLIVLCAISSVLALVNRFLF